MMKTKSNNTHGFYQHGQWFYKLPDPLRSIAYYPLDSKSISDYLRVSQRTALRICKGESTLSHAELVYLQVMVFGYIPDASFTKLRFFVRDGKLLTHTSPSFSLSSGEIIEFALQRNYYHGAMNSLLAANLRIKELEKELQGEPKPTNIIKFSDYTKK